MATPTKITLPDVSRYLERLAAERHTGRVQITLDFQEGGVRCTRVDEVTPVATIKED